MNTDIRHVHSISLQMKAHNSGLQIIGSYATMLFAYSINDKIIYGKISKGLFLYYHLDIALELESQFISFAVFIIGSI